MKHFTIIALVFMATFSFAQNAPINFEEGGQGADWTWTVFENDINPPVEIIANPDASGSNTSATVAKFTALQAGQPWAGTESLHGADLGAFVLDETNSTIKIMVWKPVISDVGIKLVAASGWAQPEIKVPNTVVNQWEELTFDFSAFPNPPAAEGQYDQIVVFPDFDLAGRTQDNVVYFDNITFSGGGTTPTEPTVAAPTPPGRNPDDVISLFSDAYANVVVDTWRTDWSVANYEEVMIDGNPTKKYSLLDYVGIETVSSQLDITEMEYVHLNIWSPNFTFFGLKLVDYGADGAFGGGDDVEHQVNFESPAQNEWIALDIPLSEFTGLTTRQNIAQYILVGQPSGTSTVFVDNFYFFAGDITDLSEQSTRKQLKVYPNPIAAGNAVNFDKEVTLVEVYDLSGKLIVSSTQQTLNTELLKQGMYTLRIVDAANQLHMQKLMIK
ncbi:MAG: T9SS type A sorting domain-containing protein [Bacteroidetes bacterium]|nr:T9SS type A sorting domain-containing protein [Bacteroidota bacterium]MBU1580384.1 T9SS type A sorting domain-containing protein [Bacteroidota bacterium]MBU2557924.1 T9SS type A sorting domain-containing protein [Bacteroidota bacterium]